MNLMERTLTNWKSIGLSSLWARPLTHQAILHPSYLPGWELTHLSMTDGTEGSLMCTFHQPSHALICVIFLSMWQGLSAAFSNTVFPFRFRNKSWYFYLGIFFFPRKKTTQKPTLLSFPVAYLVQWVTKIREGSGSRRVAGTLRR